MKTLQELYKEVIASDELKKEFMEAANDEKNGQKNVEEFLKNHGCDASFEELKAFFKEKSEEELSEEELVAVAGGKSGIVKQVTSACTMLATLGFGFALCGMT